MYFANGDLPEDEPEEPEEVDYEKLVRESGLIVVTLERPTGWIDFHRVDDPEETLSMASTPDDWAELAYELDLYC